MANDIRGKIYKMSESGDEQQTRKRMTVGLDYTSVPALSDQVYSATNLGYHFAVIPIVHPRYRRELIRGECLKRKQPLTRSDLVLTSQDWVRLIIGKLSPYFEVDTEIEHLRKQSEAALLQEMEFASHLGLTAILLPLYSSNCLNLAKIVYCKLLEAAQYQVWVHVPMVVRRTYCMESDEVEDSWEWWNKFREYCDYDKKISLALELTHDYPTEAQLDRWLGEPVKCLIINTNLFLTNQKHYPVLSRAHQDIIKRFMQLDVQYIIKGKTRHNSISQYASYINFLGKKLYRSTMFTEYSQGTEDYLQNPLQPLSENLETMVYEVFEKDPHKYNQYQLAIQRALYEKKDQANGKDIVVIVVGAGRGPLIRAVLNAGHITESSLKVYALEKNPHAVNTLQAMERELWPGRVTIISGDMRNSTPCEKADILVSELLGSFGDNELSPECLDGAQRFLKEDGISIPVSYTSWIAPMQSIKLINEVKQTRPVDKTLLSCFETPYVVHLVNKYDIDKTKPLFTFKHPNKNEVLDNRRHKTVHFRATQNSVLCGFAGYFTCDLYNGIMISTEPSTHTKDMMSWFPIFFPLSEPMQLKAGDQITVAFWRCVSKTKVWYEWCVTSPKVTPIHNPNGRSYTISQ